MKLKYDFSGLGILIVDDQAFLRSVVRNVLKGYSCHDIYEAADGEEAINVIAEGKVLSLILCDIEMKPMNGFQLVRAVRAGLTRAPHHLPIVMMTVHSDARRVKQAIDLHVNGFIVKPVRPLFLAQKIDMAVHFPLAIEPLALGEEGGGGKRAQVVRTEEEIAELKRQFVERIVSRAPGDLRAGAIVAQDVHTPAGATLLMKGMTLTEEIIGVVRGHSGLGEILVLE